MSANYWNSSQRLHWKFTRESLEDARRELKLLEKTMEESGMISKSHEIAYDLHMRIYIHSLVNKLGRRLNVRQVALSTAEVYLMRFFTRCCLKEVNLYLLITTCIYLACKIEECPQHIRTIVSEARNLWPEYISQDISKVAEFEFYLIEEMDTYLIVHHPYRSLMIINEVLLEYNQRQAGSSTQWNLSPEELQSSWSVINDSYVTDLPLLYPPHIVSAASVYLTLVLKYNHITHLHNESISSSVSHQASIAANATTSASTSTPTNSTANSTTNSTAHATNPANNAASSTITGGAAPSSSHHGAQNEGLRVFIQFLGYSNIDLEEVIEAVQEMVTLYEVWESYDEAKCKKSLELVLLNR